MRLAYIESLEAGGVKLPIMADELLATTDDARARAIIEALCEISKDSRQIFYFTARPDEVGKWSTYLNGRNDINHKVIYMNETPGDPYISAYQHPAINIHDPATTVPEPVGRNVSDYRGILNIPSFNPITHNPTQLHIARLINDTGLVYRCLRSGLTTWGLLSSYTQHNGRLEGLSDEIIREMNQKITLLEYYLELFRTGLPGLIDWEVIKESDAITRNFEADARNLLEKTTGDPVRFMEELSKLPGFQTRMKEKMKTYLSDKGYLPEDERLSEEEVKIRLQARISNMNLSEEEAFDFINGIFRK